MQLATTTKVRVRPTGRARRRSLGRRPGRAARRVRFELIRRVLRTTWCCASRGRDRRPEAFLGACPPLGAIEPPEAHTRTNAMTVPGFPRGAPSRTLIEDGVARGEAGDGELRWHTDHGFMERPVALSMLLARALPASGGDTSFANMYQGLCGIAGRAQAADRRARGQHQASHSSTGKRQPGYQDLASDDPRELRVLCIRSSAPTPRPGQGLYLGRRFGAYIPPLPLAESEALRDNYGTRDPHSILAGPSAGSSAILIVWTPLHACPPRGLRRPRPRRLHRLMTRGEQPV